MSELKTEKELFFGTSLQIANKDDADVQQMYKYFKSKFQYGPTILYNAMKEEKIQRQILSDSHSSGQLLIDFKAMNNIEIAMKQTEFVKNFIVQTRNMGGGQQLIITVFVGDDEPMQRVYDWSVCLYK